MTRPPSLDLRKRTRPIAKATFLLGAALIGGAMAIGLVSYNYSFQMMTRTYQNLYLGKAQTIVASLGIASESSDAEALAAIDRLWSKAANRPPDEYVCVVNAQGDLLLHTANPQTVGNYAGDNPVLAESNRPERKLCDLVVTQADYVGEYISSEGGDQIAAFVAIPEKRWVLGVHRSRTALRDEIRDGFRPFVYGFVLICGLLMPIGLLLIYNTYRTAQARQLASEQALQESERRYQSLVDEMPQCLFRSDRQGNLTFANRAFLVRAGRDLPACLGQPAHAFLPPELAGRNQADDASVIENGLTLDAVLPHTDPEGQPAWLEMVKNPVRDAEGRITGIQGIFWDVSVRERAKTQLERTKALFETILQSVPSGILAVDADLRLTLVNRMAEEIMCLDAKQVLGKVVTEVIPDSHLKDVVSLGISHSGQRYQWGDKRLLISRRPIFQDHQAVGGVSVFQDESELETVQRQLAQIRRLHDEQNTLVENLHDGVLVTDAQFALKANPSFGRITGTPVLGPGQEVLRVVINLRDVTELKSLEEQIKRLASQAPDREKACAPNQLGGVVAESPQMNALVELCLRVARVDSTVLLTGESGTGKDVLARLIHRLSLRHNKPFVAINCAAVPDSLLESEFFGYERGAFSGADKDGKPGLFEEADGGTLFLDEVGELPLALQVKLLKVIQEQRFRRLGSVKDRALDLRVIAATNRDLEEMVQKGQFREDLFYRLYVVPINIPPLRERREDIMPLAMNFLQACNRKYGVSRTLSQELLRALEGNPWPGNVRELQNTIERMVVTADADTLEPRHLPSDLAPASPCPPPGLWLPEGLSLREIRELVERQVIERAIASGDNLRAIARRLGVSHSTVLRKAQKLGVREGEEAEAEER
ncbi:MAG: sigma 54-interacting transcriptional regulator [Desulfarculus sp.]|nr:sigma 54-interacting transcriptional regulator [Desulfarculus sp.]